MSRKNAKTTELQFNGADGTGSSYNPEGPESFKWTPCSTEKPPTGKPILAVVMAKNDKVIGFPVAGVMQTDYMTQKRYLRESYGSAEIPEDQIVKWLLISDIFKDGILQ